MLLLTAKWSVPIMYKLLSADVGKSAVDIGVCRGESSGLPFLRRFAAVKAADGQLPILLFFKNGDSKPVKYEGKLNKVDIKSWLEKEYGGRWAAVKDHNSLTQFLISSASRPKLMLVTTRDEVPWMWRLLSILLDPIADLAVSRVTGAKSKEFIMKRFSIKQVPEILFFKNGDSKPSVYTGERTAERLRDFVQEERVKSLRGDL